MLEGEEWRGGTRLEEGRNRVGIVLIREGGEVGMWGRGMRAGSSSKVSRVGREGRGRGGVRGLGRGSRGGIIIGRMRRRGGSEEEEGDVGDMERNRMEEEGRGSGRGVYIPF